MTKETPPRTVGGRRGARASRHVKRTRGWIGYSVAALLALSMLAALLAYILSEVGPTRVNERQLHYSADRRHVFPIAGDIDFLSWTYIHWDGSNAVDIEIDPAVPAGSPLFGMFGGQSVVAITDGEVTRSDNPAGGIALILRGDDGYQYYYAHLDETWIETTVRVAAGRSLGEVGRTGRSTRYIEEHLHLSIASSHSPGLDWTADVNAAQWLYDRFALRWRERDIAAYEPDRPSGAPVVVPFHLEYVDGTPDAPALAGALITPRHRGAVAIVSPLAGEVNVHRDTVLGLRVQVTNLHTAQTIVISGLSDTQRVDDEVVRRGDRLGAAEGAVHYMLYDRGVITLPVVR